VFPEVNKTMSTLEQEIARLEKKLAREGEVVARLERLAITDKDRTIHLHRRQIAWLAARIASLREELAAGGARDAPAEKE
jgi:uncharacterized coiled-coil protein SlyX